MHAIIETIFSSLIENKLLSNVYNITYVAPGRAIATGVECTSQRLVTAVSLLLICFDSYLYFSFVRYALINGTPHPPSWGWVVKRWGIVTFMTF